MLFAFLNRDVKSSTEILLKIANQVEFDKKTKGWRKVDDDSWVLHTSNYIEDHELELILKRAGFTEDMLSSFLRTSSLPNRRQWLITEKHYGKVKNACKMYFIERFFKKTFLRYLMAWGGLVASVYLIGIACSWVIRGFKSQS